MNFITLFIVLSIINVVFSTVRSLITINGSKTIASLINGGYFAFYNIMLIYTVAEFPLWQKCLITFICNVIGVFIVKLVEEKLRKDKLWKVEICIDKKDKEEITMALNMIKIPNNSISCTNSSYAIINAFCETQKESLAVKEILKKFDAKFFVSENKTL